MTSTPPPAARRPRLFAGSVAIAMALLVPAVVGWWWGTTASGPRQALLAHVLYWLMPLYLALVAVAAWRWWRLHGSNGRTN